MVEQHGPLPPERAVPVVRRAARALAKAQSAGHSTDTRNQVFWLGAVLFFALTGKAPLDARARAEAGGRRSDAPPSPSSLSPHRVPPALDAVVRTCLADRAEERFASVVDLHVALAALPYGDVVAAAVVGPAAVVAAAAEVALDDEQSGIRRRATGLPESAFERPDRSDAAPRLRLVRAG